MASRALSAATFSAISPAKHGESPARGSREKAVLVNWRKARTSGEKVFTLRGSLNDARKENGTEWAAVEDGSISISPVNLHPLNQSGKEAYHTI